MISIVSRLFLFNVISETCLLENDSGAASVKAVLEKMKQTQLKCYYYRLDQVKTLISIEDGIVLDICKV